MNDELQWLVLNNYIGISYTEDNPENTESTKEPSYYLPIASEPEQIKRQKRAMTRQCKPLSINFDNKTGVFSSSSSGTYQVTTTSCTCPDFVRRRKPCKHMYRLLDELGLCSLKKAFPNEYEKLANHKQINDILPIATQLSLEDKNYTAPYAASVEMTIRIFLVIYYQKTLQKYTSTRIYLLKPRI